MAGREKTWNPISGGGGHVAKTHSVRSPYSGSGGWDTTHDATTGSSVFTASTTTVLVESIINSKGNDFWSVVRVFLPFNLTGEPTGVVNITAATLSVFVTGKANGDNDGDDWINVVGETTQGSPTTLGTADYDQCGAVDNPTELATRIDLGAFTINDANLFTLTSGGRTALADSFGDYFQAGLREGHDALDLQIADDTENRLTINTAAELRITGFMYPQVI